MSRLAIQIFSFHSARPTSGTSTLWPLVTLIYSARSSARYAKIARSQRLAPRRWQASATHSGIQRGMPFPLRCGRLLYIHLFLAERFSATTIARRWCADGLRVLCERRSRHECGFTMYERQAWRRGRRAVETAPEGPERERSGHKTRLRGLLQSPPVHCSLSPLFGTTASCRGSLSALAPHETLEADLLALAA